MKSLLTVFLLIFSLAAFSNDTVTICKTDTIYNIDTVTICVTDTLYDTNQVRVPVVDSVNYNKANFLLGGGVGMGKKYNPLPLISAGIKYKRNYGFVIIAPNGGGFLYIREF